MKILVFPRDESNPYQSLLYGEMAGMGAQVTYLGELTPSHTFNVLLLPLELAGRRLGGARLAHLHWVFGFSLPGGAGSKLMRRAAQAWFAAWLRTARLLGVHLVWTVHNVLPHGTVFADDVRARRQLVAACDLVIAHAASALSELAALGASLPVTAVIRHGPIGPAVSAGAMRTPGTGGCRRRFLFVGKVRPYKGVEDLLTAFGSLPGHIAAELTVAGQCDDPETRAKLRGLAERAGERVSLRLERIPDEEMVALFAVADVVVLPFRRVTTSGSAVLALSHGRPLIVPDLRALADLPDGAIARYDGTIPGLAAAVTQLSSAPSVTLAAMSAAALAYTTSITWEDIAKETMSMMTAILGHPQPVPTGQPAGRT